jgi:hypothetical protein
MVAWLVVVEEREMGTERERERERYIAVTSRSESGSSEEEEFISPSMFDRTAER